MNKKTSEEIKGPIRKTDLKIIYGILLTYPVMIITHLNDVETAQLQEYLHAFAEYVQSILQGKYPNTQK